MKHLLEFVKGNKIEVGPYAVDSHFADALDSAAKKDIGKLEEYLDNAGWAKKLSKDEISYICNDMTLTELTDASTVGGKLNACILISIVNKQDSPVCILFYINGKRYVFNGNIDIPVLYAKNRLLYNIIHSVCRENTHFYKEHVIYQISADVVDAVDTELHTIANKYNAI